jgi:diguanylate cyclase (GGDEF)-like protein/PAS domain S-box-containing protein
MTNDQIWRKITVMQNDIIRLIVVEESANDAEVILNSLRKARYPIRPRYVEDDEDLQDALTEHEWDLIISVPQVGDFTIAQVCDMVSSSKQDIPIIVLSPKLDGKSIAGLLNAGVAQVIPNDTGGCLPYVVGRELENLAERRRRKHLEQLYKETQKHNKMLLESSRDAIAYVHDGMHIHANPSYLKMFDYKSMDDLEGLPVMDLVAVNDQAKFRKEMRDFMTDERNDERQIVLEGLKSNKKRFKIAMELSQAIYDSERCVQVIIRDQSQSQELERKLKDIARRDPLTGLFNRQHFLELLEKALAKAMETHTRSVLFYIALDNFSSIREQVGVAGADPVIKNIAKVINGLSGGGALARFGEGTFTLLIADKDGKKYASAGTIANKICKAVAANVTELSEQSVVVTCSIGITQVLSAAASPQDVLGDAHKACKLAMEQGGNRSEIYKPRQSGEAPIGISDLKKLIETAIEENRLSLRYQPIDSLHGESQELYEVFLRMVDSDGQNVPTGDLFNAAENTNLSIMLDKWVLEQSIKALVEQEKKGHKTHLFIKLSDQAIKDETILLYIRKKLRASQLPGARLIIEISESVAIGQIRLAKAFISQLKTFGCKSALEHFGTGLSSETTLKHLRDVNYVKIDSSYSKGLSTNTENQEAVQQIVKMAHDLGKETIAEAVEDANSLTVLWSSEVDFAQGHYISEPLEELEYDFSEE